MIVPISRHPADGGKYDLPPRLFRQVIESRGHLDDRYSTCVATFWDNDKKRTVRFNLGVVQLRNFPFSYHAAPSVAEVPCHSLCEAPQAAHLSRVEGAAPYATFLAEPERTEVVFSGAPDSAKKGAECPTNLKGQKSPGTYVIPGQSPTGGNNAQKIGNKSALNSSFESPVENCEVEPC